MKLFLYTYLFFLCSISVSCQDNLEFFDITLNIKNINSKGNLFIAIWTDSNAFNSNKTDSSKSENGFKYGFKEKVTLSYFNKTINLPTGKYLVSIYLDENLNNKMDYNFIGIPKEQYGFSTKKLIRFRKPKFDEASFILLDDLILDISLQ
ncbi:DUF2141 domain-containing protein [Flavobacteriaceae bacterium]|nr:DUF2141 domain-containing protein [Flavobacteriaceae bacterium]MDB0042839.1 DUF2141 domain-containing protein [Flavobacteriaceae bacterium]MDB4050108.1 DUF2141 domain-containing protein [Flavobacteriaceae bacterium]MDB4087373.1 DUF2141 domain-containing protein [Flavobacteriaceae bacterium]MDB4240356.1 DUF2141 domain-containing protein [Flavobacteriaceae bacterium]